MANSEPPRHRTHTAVSSTLPATVVALSVAGMLVAPVGTASAAAGENVAGILENLAMAQSDEGKVTIDVQDGVLTVGDVAFTLPRNLKGAPADGAGSTWSFEGKGCTFTIQGLQQKAEDLPELWDIAHDQTGDGFGAWLIESNPESVYLDYVRYDTGLLSFNLVFLLNATGDKVTGFMLVPNDMLSTLTEIIFTFPAETFESSLALVDAMCQSAEPAGSAATALRTSGAISALKESHQPVSDSNPIDGIYEASGQGIGGDVPVTVTVEGGKIASVEVGDNSETQGIGSNAIEQLPGQFVGLSTTEEVDAVDIVSGATVTSTALKTAVSDCLEQAGVGGDASEGAAGDVEASDTEAASDGAYADGTYEGTGKGIGGDVPVTVTVEGGKIASVEVGDNSETQGIGSNAIEQLPELIVEANGTEGVDGVSGATVTSTAIFDAVDEALASAASGEGPSPEVAPDVVLIDGTYQAVGQGIGGDVPVTVTVEGGAIADVTVGDNSETQGIGSNAIEQLPGQFVGMKTAEEVDALDGVSGATVTSTALKDAVADCLEQARG